MGSEQDLSKIIQLLRRYHKAVRATSAGLPHLQTTQAQEQQAHQLQTAYALKAALDEELNMFLEQARLFLQGQSQRLEIARAQRTHQLAPGEDEGDNG